MKDWRENLFTIFGSLNLFEIMIPTDREKCINGLEWTFLNYADSQSLGSLLNSTEDDEED